jgi:hypothetical protein
MASLFWNTAEQMYLVALAVYAFTVGGTTAVGLVGLAQALPLVVTVPAGLRLLGGRDAERVLRFLVGIRLLAIGTAALVLAAGALRWPSSQRASWTRWRRASCGRCGPPSSRGSRVHRGS